MGPGAATEAAAELKVVDALLGFQEEEEEQRKRTGVSSPPPIHATLLGQFARQGRASTGNASPLPPRPCWTQGEEFGVTELTEARGRSCLGTLQRGVMMLARSQVGPRANSEAGLESGFHRIRNTDDGV